VTKEIDVKAAKDWDDEEAALNIKYLRDRGRDAEADEAVAARGGEPSASGEGVPSGTVDEVLAWVGDDTERAKQALDAEEESEKPRVSLMDSLESMLA
jgi:hypothetical protein